MRTLTLLLSLSLLAVAAVGCTTPAESDDPTAERQGFLEPCQADAACADDLTCESGVCTRTCNAFDSCDEVDTAGYCAATSTGGFCAPIEDGCEDPGSMPDFSECPPGQHAGLEPRAADSCLAWGCYPDTTCEPLGQQPPAQCPAGQELREIVGVDGCPTWGCVPADDCPVYNRPECAADERLVNRTDDNGCVYPECEPIECPQIAAPPADFCPEGQHIVEITRENGCMDWGCAPDDPTECPPIAAPPADSCPEGQRVIEITRENGCPDFACTAEGCEDIQEPELCFDGQPPNRRSLTANGCTILTCDPERSFDCGPDMACSFDTEYCSISLNDVANLPDYYDCLPIPEACLQASSCQCLDGAIDYSSSGATCEDAGGPPGSATLTVTYPGG